MTGASFGLVLAGVAAVATNGSYLLQHDALRGAEPLSRSGVVSTLRGLLASRDWLRGALLGYAGLAAQIMAMALAPLWLVQAVMAAGLVVALAGWARQGRHGDPARLTLAVALLALGLLAVVAGGPRTRPPDSAPLLTLSLFAGAVVLAAVALPRAARRLVRSSTDALSAGLLYGVTTTAIAAALATVGHAAVLAGVILMAGVACAIAGLLRFQRGLQAADPVSVVLLMSAAMNAIAMLGGVLLAGDGAPGLIGALGVAALCGAGFVAAAGPLAPRPAEAGARIAPDVL